MAQSGMRFTSWFETWAFNLLFPYSPLHDPHRKRPARYKVVVVSHGHGLGYRDGGDPRRTSSRRGGDVATVGSSLPVTRSGGLRRGRGRFHKCPFGLL